MFYNWLQNVYGLKDIWFLLLAPYIPNQRSQPFFLDVIWKVVKNYTTFVLHVITKYVWEKSYRWKTAKKLDAFSNSIFEPYRASALFELETWDSKGTNLSPLSIIRENLKKISWVVSEKISVQNDTLKIRKSSISRTGSDVITLKIIFGLSRPIYSIPENFMKIRLYVLEKSSKKKKEKNI